MCAAYSISGVFDEADLLADVMASLNSSELALRRFREIARVAGLVFTGYPGAPKSTKQLQASSSLFYEVFRKYDPQNRLLGQAEGEVLAQELDIRRLKASLKRMRALRVEAVTLACAEPVRAGADGRALSRAAHDAEACRSAGPDSDRRSGGAR